MSGKKIETGSVLGDFRILKKIGRGGMATVYEAEQVSLRRKVALKILPGRFMIPDRTVEKFYREAKAGGRQHHSGIVSIYAVGVHEETHYIAMELVEGGKTLADKMDELREQKDLPLGYFRDMARLIVSAADALDHVHGAGVIHRDVKPSNILLTKEGEPKVTDFGLAKMVDARSISHSGDHGGTPYYMSPEQASIRSTGIDHRSDIFSLGVTLYEMITLARPFDGETSREVLDKITSHEPRDPRKVNPRVPQDLAVICLKAMEKKPDARYQTMKSFRDDLQRYLQGDVILAKPVGPGARFRKWLGRNPVKSAALSVACVAAIAFAFVVPWVIAQMEKENASALEEVKQRAIESKKAAMADREKARAQAKLADERYEQINRLADIQRLEELEAEAAKLWPAHPEKINGLEAWIRRAEELLGRLDGHHRTLETLREKSNPPEGNDSTPLAWTFRDMEDQWWYDTLSDLVSGLQALGDPETGTLANVRKRLSFARTVMEKSIEEHEQSWGDAIASIADPMEYPMYGEMEIKPQLGLVPLGRDPESGLFEFVHLQTGDIPKRNGEDRLKLEEGTGLVFVLIPEGTFTMGSSRPSVTSNKSYGEIDAISGTQFDLAPHEDLWSHYYESPVHEVRVPAFFMSKYEMTQGQWLRCTENNPSQKRAGQGPITKLHPVETVSWHDCVEVLERMKLRLPSESEWEYTARAGTTTMWWTGNDRETVEGAANIKDRAYQRVGRSDKKYEDWLDDGYGQLHAPVNRFRPNPFGLHGVIGNVSEWCQDCECYYTFAPTDGSAFFTIFTSNRTKRGGSFNLPLSFCRSAYRVFVDPHTRFGAYGLRPARSIDR